MLGRTVAIGFNALRDAITGGLVGVGVRPNHLSIVGMILTFGAGVCYALGAGDGFGWQFGYARGVSIWLILAGALIVLSCACDILDGAVARVGRLKTEFGGFLDSTLDRYSDFVVYAGIAVYYVAQPTANVTYVLLCMMALFGSFMITYTQARAEDMIVSCKVGFWQRPERSAAILIATFGYNIPALLAQQAFLPMLTAIRRVDYTRRVLDGRKVYEDPREGPWWLAVRIWRWPRRTWGYELAVGINIAWLVFARFPETDPLRNLLERLAG